jgi:hypothetical protein
MMNAENVKYYDRVLSHILEVARQQLEFDELKDLCDGDGDLAKVIADEFQDRGFATVVETKREYCLMLKDNGKAATFYKAGGFTAELQLKSPPKTPAEKLNDHFYMIANEEGYVPIEEDPIEYSRMDRKLISYGLVEKVKDWIMPTNEGMVLADSGITVQEYISKKNTPPPATINVTGNYIGGSNYNSPLTATNDNVDIVGKDVYFKEEGKRPLLEKLSWIAGIIGGVYVIWEFFIKS